MLHKRNLYGQGIDVPSLLKKWGKVLDAGQKVVNEEHRVQAAILLENGTKEAPAISPVAFCQQQGLNLLSEAITNVSGAGVGYAGNANLAGYDPVLIAMLKRLPQQLVAIDGMCGIQPMSAGFGQIFATKARYTTQDSGLEALFNEADTDYSGTGTHVATSSVNNMFDGTWTSGTGMTTASAEVKGESGNLIAEMAFSIEKLPVEAKSRKLAAGLTHELIQDLKAIHNMDAVSYLAEILSKELESEINREMVRTILKVACLGCKNGNTATEGTFDCEVDGGGRNRVENFKGLMFQIEREANEIGKTLRRGKGNFVFASSDVCSALSMAQVLDVASNLPKGPGDVDPATKSYVGKLLGQYDLYTDPYMASGTVDFAVVGFKGSDNTNAGVFFCPYILNQTYQAQDPYTFQPRMGIESRYGVQANPFAALSTANSATGMSANNNLFFRKFKVSSI